MKKYQIVSDRGIDDIQLVESNITSVVSEDKITSYSKFVTMNSPYISPLGSRSFSPVRLPKRVARVPVALVVYTSSGWRRDCT